MNVGFGHPFFFLRHGETEWNKIGKTQGQLDSQLNETGRKQAMVAGEILAKHPIKRIVSSPLSRTRDTAKAVADHHGLEIHFNDGLKECHLGDLQGQPHGSWLAEYWTGEFDPPNGETYFEFAERAWKAMSEVVSQEPNTLIVAHGGLWRAALHYIRAEPELPMMPNALPLKVIPNGEVWNITILEIE